MTTMAGVYAKYRYNVTPTIRGLYRAIEWHDSERRIAVLHAAARRSLLQQDLPEAAVNQALYELAATALEACYQRQKALCRVLCTQTLRRRAKRQMDTFRVGVYDRTP